MTQSPYGKPTARDVAKAAGVSPATVDRVLNNRGGVFREKERLVLDAARRLRLDRALDQRLAKSLSVGVLLQAPENPFHAAVQSEFRAANRSYSHLNLTFFLYHANPTDQAQIIRQIRDLGARHDALVLTCPHSPDIAQAARAEARNKPVVTFATDIRDSGRGFDGPIAAP